MRPGSWILAAIICVAALGGWYIRDIPSAPGSGNAKRPATDWSCCNRSAETDESDDNSSSDSQPSWSGGPAGDPAENAEHHWEKHGSEFSNDHSEQDYVSDANNFVSHPPPGALTKQDSRSDTLIYDPASNTFAVRAPNGVPRTMFKPDSGMRYWNRK